MDRPYGYVDENDFREFCRRQRAKLRPQEDFAPEPIDVGGVYHVRHKRRIVNVQIIQVNCVIDPQLHTEKEKSYRCKDLDSGKRFTITSRSAILGRGLKK